MARFRHISTKMVLVLDAGTEEGKKIRKRVTIGNIREDASPDALWELAEALGKLLEHPVARVLLYKEEELEREAGDEAADENGGAQNETAADNSRAAYGGIQKEGVTKNAGAEKDAGDDRGAGETRAAYSAASLHQVHDDGDFARLWHKHAPSVYGKHAAMLGEYAPARAAPPSLPEIEAENGRSPPHVARSHFAAAESLRGVRDDGDFTRLRRKHAPAMLSKKVTLRVITAAYSPQATLSVVASRFFWRRGDGDYARLRRKHAQAMCGKHAAMLGEYAPARAAPPSLPETAAENGRSPPARAGPSHRHSEEPQAMKLSSIKPGELLHGPCKRLP